LRYDPEKRLTAEEVLQHPFIEHLFDPENDRTLVRGNPVKYFDFEFENLDLPQSALKDLILDEIVLGYSKDAVEVVKRTKKAHPEGILKSLFAK